MLENIPEAPQLPASYPAMMLLSLFPGIFFDVMDPRAIQTSMTRSDCSITDWISADYGRGGCPAFHCPMCSKLTNVYIVHKCRRCPAADHNSQLLYGVLITLFCPFICREDIMHCKHINPFYCAVYFHIQYWTCTCDIHLMWLYSSCQLGSMWSAYIHQVSIAAPKSFQDFSIRRLGVVGTAIASACKFCRDMFSAWNKGSSGLSKRTK